MDCMQFANPERIFHIPRGCLVMVTIISSLGSICPRHASCWEDSYLFHRAKRFHWHWLLRSGWCLWLQCLTARSLQVSEACPELPGWVCGECCPSIEWALSLNLLLSLLRRLGLVTMNRPVHCFLPLSLYLVYPYSWNMFLIYCTLVWEDAAVYVSGEVAHSS